MLLSEELKAVKEKGIAKSEWVKIVIEKAEELEQKLESMKICATCENYIDEQCLISATIGWQEYNGTCWQWEIKKVYRKNG